MKTRFVFMVAMMSIALSGIFASCEKEDSSDNIPSTPTSFKTMNSWIGASETDVTSQLLQMGYTPTGFSSFQLIDQDSMRNTTCSLITTDDGLVHGVSVYQMTLNQSRESTISLFDEFVQQERMLFSKLEHLWCGGRISWNDTDDDSMDGSEQYESYDELMSALETLDHPYLEMGWRDQYNNRVASVGADFNDHEYQWITLSLTDDTRVLN